MDETGEQGTGNHLTKELAYKYMLDVRRICSAQALEQGIM